MTLRRFGSQQVPPYPRQLQVFGRKKQVVRSDVCQKAPSVSSAPPQCSSPRPDCRTVIGALEDAEDYKAFEAAIIADYDAQWPLERELICPASRSTDLAGMKRSSGARPAKFCLPSMHWIVANHRT